MNGRPEPAGDAAHRATWELLPWLLNGTLDGAELETAQSHLRDCALCQADLAGLRRLRETAAAANPQPDPEPALARLMARIDASAGPHHDAAGVDPLEPAVPRDERPRAANDPRWLRRVAIAQCGLIVLLAALLAWPQGKNDAYLGLGDVPVTQGGAVVLFRPGTPEQELRRIVRASGARIVDGPTVTDAWVLAVPGSQSAASLARLRSEPAVLLAEPLGIEAAP